MGIHKCYSEVSGLHCRYMSSYGEGKWCAKVIRCKDCGDKLYAHIGCTIKEDGVICEYYEPRKRRHCFERFFHCFQSAEHLAYDVHGKEVTQ